MASDGAVPFVNLHTRTPRYNTKFNKIFYKSLAPLDTRLFETDRRLCTT